MDWNTLGLLIQKSTGVETYFSFDENEYRSKIGGVNHYYDFGESSWVVHQDQRKRFLSDCLDPQ